VKGQVIGGRWKIMHNFLRQAAYVDVYAGCGAAVASSEAGVLAADGTSTGKLAPLCYLRNDSPLPFSGAVVVSLIALASGELTKVAEISAEVGAGGAAASLFCPDGDSLLGSTVSSVATCGNFTSLLASAGCEPTTCFLDVRVKATTEARDDVLYAHNELLLAAPFQLQLPQIKLSVSAAAAVNDDGSVSVAVQADSTGVAAYVWLSTLAAGFFEPNGFMLAERSKTIKTIKFFGMPFGTLSADGVALLQASVRVEHLGEHLPPPVT
jgi:beta-mannosidase